MNQTSKTDVSKGETIQKMKFRSQIQCQPLQKVNLNSQLLLIGSCFTENLYQNFQMLKIPLCHNPYGITYNPCSISQQILNLHENKEPILTKIEQQYYPFEYHGSFRKATKEETDTAIQESWNSARKALTTCTDVFLTLGSAYAWFKDGNIVNNCHKRPSNEFRRRLLGLEEIVPSLRAALATFTDSTTITFTVSPIRHLRDGMIENNISKSLLRTAIHIIAQEDRRVQYFPAFEIMMDDLRDYRFYEDDLLHPSPMAIRYIWEQVQNNLLSESLRKQEQSVLEIHKRLEHRPIHANSREYQRFLEETDAKIQQAQKNAPHLNWSFEKERLSLLRNHFV